MTGDPVIQVQGVSKAYHIWRSPAARLKGAIFTALGSIVPPLKEFFAAQAAAQFRDFYALKDISFEVRKGESVGIIGRNGSGKSTLLQIIAGTLQPSAGTVNVNGRVAALLELGSGFNPEFTGRENVFLNGAVLGLSRAEVEARFDDIAAFADIGDFIDQPVKTYSSGMMIRLAFAVAVSVEPEILIVDEALSVGDVFFQQKCFKRVHEMLDRGVSLLFVSHDTAAVQNLCDRAVLLVQGEKKFEGPPEEATSRYFSRSSLAGNLKSSMARHAVTDQKALWGTMLGSSDIRAEARSEHGARELEISRVGIFDLVGVPTRNFVVGEKLRIVAELVASREIVDPNTGIHFYDRMNNLVFAAGTRQLRTQFADLCAGEKRIISFVLEMAVQPGIYTLSVGCGQASDDPNSGYIQHRLEGLGPVTVLPASDGTWPFYGLARLPFDIEIYG
jgi:ABC-type polysaccharide/polyol phosphate transport system ATPase subunit